MEERILIVDDEKAICSTMARWLSTQGCSCVTAKGGEESLYYFYREKFPMIISDIHMPEMNGIELLTQVKRLNPQTMVIIVTAFPKIAAGSRETMPLGLVILSSHRTI